MKIFCLAANLLNHLIVDWYERVSHGFGVGFKIKSARRSSLSHHTSLWAQHFCFALIYHEPLDVQSDLRGYRNLSPHRNVWNLNICLGWPLANWSFGRASFVQFSTEKKNVLLTGSKTDFCLFYLRTSLFSNFFSEQCSPVPIAKIHFANVLQFERNWAL